MEVAVDDSRRTARPALLLRVVAHHCSLLMPVQWLDRGVHIEDPGLALDADMTMRAFILSALREKGLSVTDHDLKDQRRRGGA